MKTLILLAALLLPVAAGAEVIHPESRDIVLFNRDVTSDLVGFSVQRNGVFYENWLAGEEWPEVNAIEPGASSSFKHICSSLPGVYLVNRVSVETVWLDRDTLEYTYLSEHLDPCEYRELFLTPQGEVGR